MSGADFNSDLIPLIIRLKKDPVRNSSIMGFVQNYPPTLILTHGDSILIKGKSDREWIYISGESESELKTLLSKLQPDDLCFASIEAWMIPAIIRKRKIEWKLEAIRFYLPDNVILPANKISPEPLNKNDAEFIVDNSNYKQYIEPKYIRERIVKSFSAGIYENGKLAAWALTHDDGAIGALHVLDEFRGKSYAAEIVICLSDTIRKSGMVPVAQIEEKNLPALKLFSKYGFIKDRKISWIKLKV